MAKIEFNVLLVGEDRGYNGTEIAKYKKQILHEMNDVWRELVDENVMPELTARHVKDDVFCIEFQRLPDVTQEQVEEELMQRLSNHYPLNIGNEGYTIQIENEKYTGL